MSLMEYESQWQSIMADNMFTEKAVITDGESISFEASGVFFSGSYGEVSNAAYAPKMMVEREFFRLSSLEIPEEIQKPWETLVGMKLSLSEREVTFRISQVSGKRGGDFTLSIQENLDG